MVSTFLLCYPLSALFTRIPSSRPNLAHLYSLAISAFYLGPWLGFGAAVWHLLADCGVAYAAVAVGRGRMVPWGVFA
jgi:lysophospholipid acyltransferase